MHGRTHGSRHAESACMRCLTSMNVSSRSRLTSRSATVEPRTSRRVLRTCTRTGTLIGRAIRGRRERVGREAEEQLSVSYLRHLRGEEGRQEGRSVLRAPARRQSCLVRRGVDHAALSGRGARELELRAGGERVGLPARGEHSRAEPARAHRTEEHDVALAPGIPERVRRAQAALSQGLAEGTRGVDASL